MGNCVSPRDPLVEAIPRSSGIDASAVRESGLPIIFLIGGPGAGKRTQCTKVAEKYGFLSIISTDLLRDEVATRSQRGVILARLMSQGRLVPPDVLFELIKIKMLSALGDTRGFVLSGFPREKEQCTLFERHVRSPDLVVYLQVRNSLLKDRILARTVTETERHSHSFQDIKKRIKTFRRKNDPIVKHYKKRLAIIDGENEEAKVFEDFCLAVENTLRNIGKTPAS